MSEKQVDKGQQYVQDARAHGKSDRDIRRALERAGWRESRIEQLLATPAVPSQNVSESASSSRFEVPAYGENMGTGRTLSEAASALMYSPIPFFLAGLAVGLTAVIFVWLAGEFVPGTRGAVDLHLVVVFALLAPGFTCLCRMAMEVLRGQQARLPTWRDIRRLGLTALLVGAVCAIVLSIAAFWPIMMIASSSGLEARGFYDPFFLLPGLIALILGLPFSLALTYLVALPALGMALPAVADGAGVGRALLVSSSRGFSNFGAVVLLEIVGTLVLGLFFVAGEVGGGIVQALGIQDPATFNHPLWVLGGALLFSLAVALFAPWLAAVVSSAYLQATGGGSQRQSRLRPGQVRRRRPRPGGTPTARHSHTKAP